MAATTISRTALNALVDDSGSNLDGSIWNKAAIASVIHDAIDSLIANNLELGGTLLVPGLISSATGIRVTTSGSSPGTASIYRHATSGMSVEGVTGSAYDFALFNPSNIVYILRVPTGTTSVEVVNNTSTHGIIVNANHSGGTANLFLNTTATAAGTVRNWLITSNFDAAGDLAFRSGSAEGNNPHSAGTTHLKISRTGGVSNPTHGTTASAANLFIDSGTGLISRSTSSLRYKTDIEDIPLARVANLLDLRPVSFRSLSAVDTAKSATRRYIGLIAEEVHEVFPELVQYDGLGRPDEVQYGRIPVLLLLACRRLHQRIVSLEQRLAAAGIP